MKKILFAWSAILLASCSMKDQGIKNAEQFVIEKYGLNMDNIKSVEGVEQDSLLGTLHLGWVPIDQAKAATAYYKDEIRYLDYMVVEDSLVSVLNDADTNWRYNGVNISELKKDDRYSDAFRRVIKVTVTYKSTDSRSYRVLMDRNGEKPNMTEDEVLSDIAQKLADIYTYRPIQ